jgi:hypothetical protein
LLKNAPTNEPVIIFVSEHLMAMWLSYLRENCIQLGSIQFLRRISKENFRETEEFKMMTQLIDSPEYTSMCEIDTPED